MVGMYIHNDIIAERRVRECGETKGAALDFSQLYITRIPPETAELTWLKEINFDAEYDKDGVPQCRLLDLSEAPEFFGNFTQLETLNMNCTGIIKLPLSLTNLTLLKKLALPGKYETEKMGKIENLSTFLRAWTNLETLSISLSNIPALAECLDYLPRLSRLEITGMWYIKKTEFKRSLIRLLQKLRNAPAYIGLSLDDGKDKKIMNALCKLSNLEELKIEGENTVLPESLVNLGNLKSLHLLMPNLKELPACIGSFSQLKKLHLENMGINKLPESIGNLSQLEELIIDKHNFRHFDRRHTDCTLCSLPESIGHLDSLKVLELNSTKLDKLPRGLQNLKSLEVLKLYDNSLTELPPMMAELKSLKKLSIGLSDLAVLPDFIGDYPELEELIIRYCNLKTAPEFIGRLHKIKRLEFTLTAMENLPESIGNLVCLESLELDGWNGGTLPDTITNCLSLRRLQVIGLECIPENIGNLTGLEKLHLKQGNFKEIPASLGNCSALKELVLDSPNLRIIPETIGDLSALEYLDISIYDGNQYDIVRKRKTYKKEDDIHLPESLGGCSKLVTIKLQGSYIIRLPETIGKLAALESLILSAPIRDIPESIGNCTSIKQLELFPDDALTMLPGTFGNLTALETVIIRGAALSGLPDLSNLGKLRVLELVNTKLEVLPEWIGRLGSLQSFRLSNSPIKTLPESIGNLSRLRSLDITDTDIKTFPRSMDGLSEWGGVEISAEYMTPLLESIASLKYLPYITVENVKERKLPLALTKRKDFYKNGDRFSPRISCENYEATEHSVVITSESFIEPPWLIKIFRNIFWQN
jgi:Leucine-rich repeat (LRR) protein